MHSTLEPISDRPPRAVCMAGSRHGAALPMWVQAAGRATFPTRMARASTVLDTPARGIVRRFPSGKRPRGLIESSMGRLLYVAVSGLPKCPPSVPDEESPAERDLQADGVAVIEPRH